MTLEGMIVIGVVIAVIAVLALTRLAPDALMMAALTFLLVVPVPSDSGWKIGILNLKDGFAGFSNTGMLTVGVLFVVVTGLRETGGIDWIAQRLLGRPKGTRSALSRIILPVCGFSAFLNNTPVVAMMIPAVSDWAKRLHISPSKLMIPLSYAAILGGTCSLIGTSTNLVVNGLVIGGGGQTLGMFDITRIGLPAVIVGATFLILLGPKLLPQHGAVRAALEDARQYTLELLLPKGSAMADKTIEQAGLRNLPGCFLVDIERGGQPMGGVGPQTTLREGDRLLFAGVVDAIRDLQNMRDLAPATDQVFKLDSPRYHRRLFEAVPSRSNPIIGRTIRNARFRNRYNGVVLAVARDGQRVGGRIGDIEIRPGDTLLIEADEDFANRYRDNRDFLLVSRLEGSTPRRHTRAPVAFLILAAMVAAATIGWLDMLQAALLAAGLMIMTRCCTVTEARQSVDWSVLIVIAAALGLGKALEVSGAAGSIAGGLLSLAGAHPWLVLLVIYAVTSLLTEVITNNAAVVLTFPIAHAAATEMGVNFAPFIFAIMMAGSASFATPLGYQTNMMVYGPGGYSFGDFLRIGVPMNVLMCVTCVTLIPFIWPF